MSEAAVPQKTTDEPAQAGTGAPLLSLRGLERRFALPSHFLALRKPVLHAVNGVDLDIARGEAFCVVGESGCGKTTIGRIAMGLLPPSRGEVNFDGTRVDHLSDSARRPFRARMGMVFQNPHASLNPRRSVFETLAEPLRHLRPEMTGAEVEVAVAEVMAATGCDKSWGPRLPHEFSGGQRQRIAIARALVTAPEFIVADEPVSALDVSVQAQILNLLTDLRRDRGLTFLFITHDLAVVEHFADRVAVMYLGQVMELAPVEDIFSAPRHPYTQLLLSAIPKLDREVDEVSGFERLGEVGEPPNPLDLPKGCPFAARCPLVADRCRSERPRLLPAGRGKVACHAVEEGRDAI